MPVRIERGKRSVLYPKREARFFVGKNAIICSQAKEWLGWQTDKDSKFGNDFLLKLPDGTKIRCTNNIKNRPFDFHLMKTLAQEILRGHYRLNFETIIFGRTGLVLSGQHRLIALAYACILWQDEPEAYPYWKKEPTIDSLVGFGCVEDDIVVNTLDTGKRRSLSDVFYRSETFANVDHRDRVKMARMLEHAVRMLWYRTGATTDAFNPVLIRTHRESTLFVENHLRLLECVKYIYEENEEKRISKYIGPGYASALLYLMIFANSNQEKYVNAGPPNESVLDNSAEEKAEQFWALVDSPEFMPLKTAVTQVSADESDSIAVRSALLIKAWLAFSAKEKITSKDLELEFVGDPDNLRRMLDECPVIGGIDIGSPANLGPSEEEIADVEAKIREERAKKEENKSKPRKPRRVRKG